MKRSPSSTAEMTSNKYTKASAKHRYGEVSKHTVSLGSHLPCYTLISTHGFYTFADLLH